MDKLIGNIQSDTQKAAQNVASIDGVAKTLDYANTAGETVSDVINATGKSVLITLSKAWIGIGLTKPATSAKEEDAVTASTQKKVRYQDGQVSETPNASPFDTSKMWSIKFGEYFMPLSQTYSVRARKTLNTSGLVDGIDIIQQTRKEAKTIDCTLKISVNENQERLQLIHEDVEEVKKIAALQEFLEDLYEDDVVFAVDNETLNDTIKVEYVIMSSYRFTPRAGSKVYIFEFSLTEVKFGDNVLTFDERQLKEPI